MEDSRVADEMRAKFDAQEYEKECRREKKRLKANPDQTKINYWFTRAYRMPEVSRKAFVDEHPEPMPQVLARPRWNDSRDCWDAYHTAKADKEWWDRNGGCLKLYCPAILRSGCASGNVMAFLDLSHVHGGFYERPMQHFSVEDYPRYDGKDHCIVEDEACSGPYLNITKDWDTLTPDQQVTVLRHVKAIGQAPPALCNDPDSIAEMVHIVRVLSSPEDGVPVSP